MRILITGAAGRLGGQLATVLKRHSVIAADAAEFDITDFAATRAFVGAAKPDLIIHPAAWTDVDGCARDPEQAIRVNGFGAQHMSRWRRRKSAPPILLVSSNEVFSGKTNRPYREYDPPRRSIPTATANGSASRRSCASIRAITSCGRRGCSRTAARTFIQSILSAALAGKPLRVVVNEVANPTYNDDLADAIARLIETERYGIYHFVNAGRLFALRSRPLRAGSRGLRVDADRADHQPDVAARLDAAGIRAAGEPRREAGGHHPARLARSGRCLPRERRAARWGIKQD